jgi:CheY-like chemotaxis protein
MIDRSRNPPAARVPIARAPRVLVYDPERDGSEALVACLRRLSADAYIEVSACGQAPPIATGDIDVAFLNVGAGSCDGLAVASRLMARGPWIQVVFWTRGGAEMPAALAARSFGVERVLLDVQLESWVEDAFAALVRMARGRREYLAAEETLPPVPQSATPLAGMSLPEAERRLRESYLRRLVAESCNDRAAARRAGVPYTTLRSMLEKLGIR